MALKWLFGGKSQNTKGYKLINVKKLLYRVEKRYYSGKYERVKWEDVRDMIDVVNARTDDGKHIYDIELIKEVLYYAPHNKSIWSRSGV